MRVPTRKPGIYTHDKKDPHITESKYCSLKNKLQVLKSRRPALIDEVKRLALDGDFSENHAYSLAKGKLRGLNQKMLEIENHLKKSIIIKKSKSNFIEIGSTVEVEVNGKIKELTILGSSETNPSTGIISHLSPIGEALINRKVGHEISLNIKDRTIKYKIIKIK
ncbi:MAG: GreA/GreB family elongation factor [Patescibacteria group bacterium]|jgi:transcription elongation factor GreA|nr:GreA/GreB family elongation factor [Patescibacteria group bacterium]